MPRRRMMDYNMMEDGRNPYGSRGGYVSSRRMRRMRDRGMDYGHYGIRGGEHYSMESDYPHSQYNDERSRRDYESSRQSHMDYGHSPMKEGKTYYPIEAMGTFNGYWGTPEHDYGRMRGRRDYAYDMGYDYRGRDYGYDYGSEMLDDKELEHWAKKLEKDVDEQYRHLFSKDNIKMRAEQMGIKFDKFSLEEYMVTILMMFTDYHKSLGTSNMDIYYKLAKDWLCDEDVAVQYGEKLASYYDNIVDPE